MTNLFDDILIPGSPGGKQPNTPSLEPPILNSSKSTAIGCWLIAGSAFVFLILLIAVGGFFVVSRRMRAQQEVAQAEKKAREAAEAQKRYFEQLEADELRNQEEVARFDKKREEAWKAAELETNRMYGRYGDIATAIGALVHDSGYDHGSIRRSMTNVVAKVARRLEV